MINKKYFLQLIIIMLAVFAQNIFSQELTLKQSIELGLKNSKDLIISKSKVVGAEEKINEFGSQMLPQLKLNASYTKLSDVIPFQIATPFFPISIKIADPVLNNYQIKLSLQQPLFTGFRLSSLKNTAEYNFEVANLEYESSINDYAIKIQEAFWNFYNAKQIVELTSEQLTSLNNNVTDTKNFLDNGLVSLNDLLKLQVQQSNTELKLIEAKNNLDLARMNFNRVIGVSINSDTKIITQEFGSDFINYNPGEILAEAKSNRNELKALEKKVSAADESITSANSTWFPNIYLFGDIYYANPNQRIFPQRNQFDDTWDVGVSLNWDLWDWGLTSSKSSQAEQLKIQAETSLAQLNEAIEIEVYQTYFNYNKSKDKIIVSRKAVEQAEENYRITKEKYDVQLATSSELVDAQTYLLSAKTNLSQSLSEYELLKVKLDRSIGRRIY